MSKLEELFEQSRGHLEPGEEILSAIVGGVQTIVGGVQTKASGKKRGRIGVMLATDRRVFFYARKLIGYEVESFSYPSISALSHGKGLTGASVRFVAAGNEIRMRLVKEAGLEQFVAALQVRMGTAPERD